MDRRRSGGTSRASGGLRVSSSSPLATPPCPWPPLPLDSLSAADYLLLLTSPLFSSLLTALSARWRGPSKALPMVVQGRQVRTHLTHGAGPAAQPLGGAGAQMQALFSPEQQDKHKARCCSLARGLLLRFLWIRSGSDQRKQS
jgi:hypothetical protein